MFFIVSKILVALITPITFILLPFLWAMYKHSKKWLWVSILALFIFGNSIIANYAMMWWERPLVPLSQLEKKYDLGIILTGVTHNRFENSDRVHFTRGADRVLHPVQLYKEGYIQKILVSGGSGAVTPGELREAEEIKRVLLLANIPEDDIIVEKESRNTYENAQFTAEIIERDFKDAKLLLITSAFHMRRSEACFEKAGVNFDIFPAHFLGFSPEPGLNLIYPDERNMYLWTILFREWMGLTAYKIIGYI